MYQDQEAIYIRTSEQYISGPESNIYQDQRAIYARTREHYIRTREQ